MIKFQIGKNGVNKGVIESLKLAFKNSKIVRISVLKSSIRDRKKIREMADEISSKLGKNYVYKIIGFTIIMRRTSISKI